MNSNNTLSRIELARSQILDAVASHLHGLGIARNMDIVEMEIFGMPKQDLIPITFKEIPVASMAKQS